MTITKVKHVIAFDREDRKRTRWIVCLQQRPLPTVVRHRTTTINPTMAITEAMRVNIENCDTFHVPKDERGPVDAGWLRVIPVTDAGIHMPHEWRVRLEAYGDSREAILEHTDSLDDNRGSEHPTEVPPALPGDVH